MSDRLVDLLALAIGLMLLVSGVVLPAPLWNGIAICGSGSWLGSYFGVRALYWFGLWPGSPRSRR